MCYTDAEHPERRRRAKDCGRRTTEMNQTVEQKYPRAFHGCRPQHALWDDFSVRHPKMPPERRAKIFSPFDALRGFDLAIEDKLRLYVDKREPGEEEQLRLNEALTRLFALTHNRGTARERPVRATVTFFVPCQDANCDAYGCRGSYETVCGTVRKVDPLLTRTILIEDRTVDFSELAEITINEEE